MRHRVRVVAAVSALAVVVAAVVLALWWPHRGTTFAEAVRLAPAGTERVSWVHWSEVRRELGVDLGPDASGGEVEDFMSRAFEEDLSTTSALPTSAVEMHQDLGISPATIEWEMFAQGKEGAVEVLGMDEEFDAGELADRLAGLNFDRPDEDALDGGVWVGGVDVLARAGRLTPELQHFAIFEDEGLVLTSDQASSLEHAVEVVRGDADHLESVEPVVEATGAPLAASVYTSAYTCSALAMSQADSIAQREADALLARAGETDPLTGFAISEQPDGEARVAMSLANEDQAAANAESRAALASGPAPGQGGTFTDRFTVESARSEGNVVILDLDPREGTYVLSDLGAGPVLFATC